MDEREQRKERRDESISPVDIIRSSRGVFKRIRQAVSILRFLIINPLVGGVVFGVGAIVIIALIMLLRGDNPKIVGTFPTPTPAPPVRAGDDPSLPLLPGLTLFEKEGPSQVDEGEVVTYIITVTYEQNLDVLIYDPIAQNAEYVSSSPPGEYDELNREISWRLQNFEPVSVDGDARTWEFEVSLRATVDKSVIVNQAFATASSPSLPSNPNATDFESLMRGQGRNVGILGDEASFVASVYNNLSVDGRLSGASRSSYEDAFGKIYRKAVSWNINPAIFVAIWGVEASLSFNDTEFGCKPFYTGFDEQLRCGVEDALGRLMNRFDEIALQDGVPVPYTIGNNTCFFDDPFLYAYEGYTPTCVMDDGNDHAHTNFVIYYKLAVFGDY